MNRAVPDVRHRRPMPPSEENFRRLLHATLELHAKGAELEALSRLATLLLKSALVVAAGELWLLGELRLLHQGGRDLLSDMGESESDSSPHLAKLEGKLAAAEWALLPELRDLLERKAKLHTELVVAYEQQLTDSATTLGELKEAVAAAGRVMAPLEAEAKRLRELEDLQRRAERALRDKQYGDVPGPAAKLSTYRMTEHNPTLASLGQKQAAAASICRQADLLFLRSPRDIRGRYLYTVLLRTPSEPGTQGVNVQASTTLVEQDRQEVLEAVKDIAAYAGDMLSRRDTKRDLDPLPTCQPAKRDLGAAVCEVGELMYRLFMPEEMRRYIDETPCSLTITTNDLELPWELMFQRADGFLYARPIARVPLGHAFPRRDRGTAARRKRLKFLLIQSGSCAGLPALPGAEREVRAVHEALLLDWRGKVEVDLLDADAVTGRELNRRLQAGHYDVIHYAGHAYVDAEHGDLSGLMLKGGEVFFAQKVRRLLEGQPLVFLNACQSGAVGRTPVETIAHAQPAGLASAFIYGGAVACIGSLWPIYDASAAAFAIAFYRHVLEGNMIGEAMRLARREIRDADRDDPTWAAFVLYGNPTYRHSFG